MSFTGHWRPLSSPDAFPQTSTSLRCRGVSVCGDAAGLYPGDARRIHLG